MRTEIMNSSAITNSIMPTVSIPGASAQESAGSGFGDVMNSVKDNWSERNAQIKNDAAKSAQSNWEKSRSDAKAHLNNNDAAEEYDARNARRDDEPRHIDKDDHAEVREQKPDEHQDVSADRSDDTPRDPDAQASNEPDASGDDANTAKEISSDTATNEDSQGTGEATKTDAVTDNTVVDPNQPVQAVPLPGSPEALALANAKAQTVAAASGTAQNSAAANNGQPAAGMTANGAASDGTTDGLMSSTALSQPAAGASAKMAMNAAGEGDAKGDELSSDKFLSRVVDSMSGDGKGKTETPSNASTANNTAASGANAGTTQQSAGNPAQAAQQAMAAAAGAQAPTNTPAQPQAATANGNAAVSATTTTDGSAQAVNGQVNSTNSLNQAGTNGQTARHAPAQPVQQQVAVSIRNAASEGVDKISVQLRPEHLGRVDVKLEIGHDGRVQGVIQADTRETLDMLRQDSRALQQALKDAGLNADSQSFTFEHRNEGGQGQDGNGRSQMTANQGSSPDDGDVLSGAELAEHVGIGYGINPNGLVDIRI
ncbi:hypothetical protein COO92_10760 [Thalassospira lohafexi]|uniref:Flagellar hook-length control protein-like C-terminal domain-containing protein n=2 Tax=Thalassospira lohafexi TaxID=744227 RepID=A0A2N3L5V3_9PROT|nr:hypothetical protein COO92_10760 [Thalassospira lohafexi]